MKDNGDYYVFWIDSQIIQIAGSNASKFACYMAVMFYRVSDNVLHQWFTAK